MKPNLLMIGNGSERILDRLSAEFTLHFLSKIDDLATFFAETGPSVEYVMTNGHDGVSTEIMDGLPNLKIVSSYGVGYDAIDANACAARGVVVTHTPNVLNDEVANTAILLWLATSRKLVQADTYLREGRWLAEGPFPLTRSVQDRTVGILGLGRIGQAIADRLAMFNSTVVYHSRTQKDVAYRFYDDLCAMAADCDVLICITPGGEETRGIVSADVMNALGPEGVLINVARGSVIDEPAMVAALQEGRLGGAGLDVFDKEPIVPEALFAMDNVVLQPHVGSATVETRQAMGDLTCDNLLQFKADGTTVTAVPECAHL
jgi:lactate dehydrogenase-like 2-hydroxyacid dehydrogenase